MKKILLYHVYCLPTELLYYNLQKIISKIHLFDEAVFKLNYEPPYEKTKENVKKFLLRRGIKNLQIVECQNSPLFEGTGFKECLENILLREEDGYIFYAHTKAASCHMSHPNYKYFNNLIDWADMMYEYNLSENSLKILEQSKPTSAGCFQRGFGHEPFYGSLWHYSGSFYWLNIEKLKKLNWNNFSYTPYMTESYPGRVVDINDTISFINVNKDLYVNSAKDQ